MIKIVFSEVDSPTDSDQAISLNNSSGVRAVNCSKKPYLLHLIDNTNGETRTLTLVGNESLILKKHSYDKVYASSKTVRIAGVSIY